MKGRPAVEEAIRMRRDAAWWGAVIVSMLTAGFLPAAAGASELIGRNATGVRLQADASGRAAVTFRSEGGHTASATAGVTGRS
jgi:hypothetical protein